MIASAAEPAARRLANTLRTKMLSDDRTLLAPGTRLSSGCTLVDAVTGEKVSSEPYDMFE